MMGKNEKTLIQKAVILPAAIALLIAVISFAVYPSVKDLFPFGGGTIALSDFENQKEASIYKQASGVTGGTVQKSGISGFQSNTEVGKISLKSISVPLIYDADDINMKDSASLLDCSEYIGETGCAYIYGYKSVLGNINNMQAGDKISVNTAYGDYVFSVTDVELKNGESTVLSANPKTERGLVIYTNEDNGAGISSTYCVVTAEMLSGPAVAE